jgi:predicted chitinase
MPKETFTALCHWHWTRSKCLLADTRRVSVEEQIAMFLAVVTRNESNRAIQERFQHSGETVHRYFYAVLQAFVCLHKEVVLLPLPAIF